jgi:hypothetical protein
MNFSYPAVIQRYCEEPRCVEISSNAEISASRIEKSD